MAILISKSKAQDKGAMTLQATANSTFIASLFILEDNMKSEEEAKRIVKRYVEKSREEARRLMGFYLNPELSRWTHCVHHIDKDPFNNEISNLQIVTVKEHRRIHSKRRGAYKKE